jgi:predicted DNA-binding transcriptional regulator AlpA
MATTVLTAEDLQEFKIELLQEIKTLLKSQKESNLERKWLKSSEVRKLLGISAGTIQNMRINGTLPYSKMGGVILYDHEEILKILQSNRIHNVVFRS